MGTITIYGTPAIAEFGKKYPAACKSAARFVALVTAAQWRNLMEVKASFPAVDYVDDT